MAPGRNGASACVPDETLTPFACVTFFRALSHDMIEQELDYLTWDLSRDVNKDLHKAER